MQVSSTVEGADDPGKRPCIDNLLKEKEGPHEPETATTPNTSTSQSERMNIPESIQGLVGGGLHPANFPVAHIISFKRR